MQPSGEQLQRTGLPAWISGDLDSGADHCISKLMQTDASLETKSSAALQADVRYQVLLCRVLWRHGAQGAKQHEDPWRLFKELWFALLETGVSTACMLWYSVANRLEMVGQAIRPQTWPVSVWPGLTGRLAGKVPAA